MQAGVQTFQVCGNGDFGTAVGSHKVVCFGFSTRQLGLIRVLTLLQRQGRIGSRADEFVGLSVFTAGLDR